jgi:hypothetical protein
VTRQILPHHRQPSEAKVDALHGRPLHPHDLEAT